MDRDAVSSLLRKSFPKFSTISKRDEKMGLVPLQASREASFAIQRVVKDKLLLECDPISLRDAFENCAMIGLSLNPALQYAVIIPVWNKDRQLYEATLWPMYRGFIKLGCDTGLITSCEVENVYAQDEFVLRKDSDRTHYSHTINHRAQRNTDENPYFGTYCITRLTNDPERPLVEWVPADDIEKMKLSSKNYDASNPNPNSVWVKWEDEMRRKSALKRAQKWWPKSDGGHQERLARAVEIDNRIESDRSHEKPIEGETSERAPPPVKKITKEQAAELTKMAADAGLKIEKVCGVYFIDKIEQLPEKLYGEVKIRIENAGKLRAEKQKGNKPAPDREPGQDG
jgi:phage RecT family recombinase